MKTCTKCGVEHPVSFFNKDRTRVDGLFSSCKECSRRQCRETYQKHLAAHKALKQRWKAENRERHSAINKAWAAANPEKRRKFVDAWRAKNPEKVRQHTRDYFARLRRATPKWVDRELMKFIRSECPPGWQIDHIHPLGGENFCGLNVPWNIQYLRPEENLRKYNKLPVDAGGHSDL